MSGWVWKVREVYDFCESGSIGVFSTEEKAEAFLAAVKRHNQERHSALDTRLEIVCVELDPTTYFGKEIMK